MGTHPEYDANQKRAWQSWHMVMSAIVYFNDPQPELESPITRFIPSEPYPRILDLVEFCMNQEDWCCIINADIVITERFRAVEKKLKSRNLYCSSSWRHEFDPAVGIDPCSRVDNGLDYFGASPKFWEEVYQDVPDTLRLGSQQWDSWMLAYFGQRGASGFAHISDSKCVRHPKHGSRSYGPPTPPVHFHGWPVMMGPSIV